MHEGDGDAWGVSVWWRRRALAGSGMCWECFWVEGGEREGGVLGGATGVSLEEGDVVRSRRTRGPDSFSMHRLVIHEPRAQRLLGGRLNTICEFFTCLRNINNRGYIGAFGEGLVDVRERET